MDPVLTTQLLESIQGRECGLHPGGQLLFRIKAVVLDAQGADEHGHRQTLPHERHQDRADR